MSPNASRKAATADERLLRGTSLYHTRTEEVLWVDGIWDDTVQLTSRADSFEMDREALIEQTEAGEIVIETQPLTSPTS